MKKARFLGVLFGILALISLSYPRSGPQEEERPARPASPTFAPPVDPIPPNLNAAEIPDRLKRLQDFSQYPGNSFENRYRGVVAANANGSSAKDELIVDFGSNGVWAYDGLPDLGTWHQISGANPDWILSVHWGDPDDDEIIGDFGSLGLWMWDYSGYPGTWTQLSGANADHGFAADDDGDGKEEIQVDFGSLGLWRFDLDDTSWVQQSTLNANPGGIGKDHWVTGAEEGVWSFPGFGVWSFHQGVSVCQLSGADASYPNVSAEFGIADDSEELIMSFGDSLGLWLAEEDTYPGVVWHQLSGEDPVGLKEVRWVGAADYELLVDFSDVDGLWYWDYSGYPGTWVKLSDNDPGEGCFEPFDPNGYSIEIGGDEEVAVDFAALGLWLYDHTTGGFTQLTSSDPEYMVRADLYNSGNVDEWLIVDFGTAGLWTYNGFDHSWHQLSALSPD